MRFKKRPVEVEAEQFIIWDFKKVPVVINIMGTDFIIKGELFDRYIEIPTKEGIMRADVGDWIVKEPFDKERKFYPCKQDVFEKTYEKIGD